MAVEIRALIMCGVAFKDRMQDSVVQEHCNVKGDALARIEKGML